MTPAEFRCKREFLGLSMSWVARKLIVNDRTVRRWEDPRDGVVPSRAEDLINELYEGAAKAVSFLTVQQMKRREKLGGGKMWDTIPLPVPAVDPEGELPASWFRMIAVRVAERTGQPLSYTT